MERAISYENLLRQGCEVLAAAGIENHELDAWYLLEYACGISRSRFLADRRALAAPDQAGRYIELIRQRASRIPLQHLTGCQEFMGLPFWVNSHVLIPRQDTEILVEEALSGLQPGMHVLDMCTGSGCILISLLKLASGVTGTGVDISEKALEVARRNAAQNQVDADFLQSDLFAGVRGRYDRIVSNPPYIPTGDIAALMPEVQEHEPHLALDGKEDGVYFYRRIIAAAPDYLKLGGKLLLEIGWDQAGEVTKCLQEAGYGDIRVKQDLAGMDRVVTAARRE